MEDIGFLVIAGFGIYLLLTGVRDILIGTDVVKHPMYDTEEKKKYALRKGLWVLIPSLILSATFLGIYLVLIGRHGM